MDSKWNNGFFIFHLINDYRKHSGVIRIIWFCHLYMEYIRSDFFPDNFSHDLKISLSVTCNSIQKSPEYILNHSLWHQIQIWFLRTIQLILRGSCHIAGFQNFTFSSFKSLFLLLQSHVLQTVQTM